MTDPQELFTTLDALAQALDALGVTWAIGGSVASTVYGEPRSTNDVDVIAALDPRTAERLAALLGPAFYCDPISAADAARNRSSFNVIDTRGFIKVDVFVPAPGPLGAGQLARRRHIALTPDAPALPILGPEDIVLQKLNWFRLGGGVSDRQWRDVLSVLRAQRGHLDDTYLDSTARAVDLDDLLRRARADASSS